MASLLMSFKNIPSIEGVSPTITHCYISLCWTISMGESSDPGSCLHADLAHISYSVHSCVSSSNTVRWQTVWRRRGTKERTSSQRATKSRHLAVAQNMVSTMVSLLLRASNSASSCTSSCRRGSWRCYIVSWRVRCLRCSHSQMYLRRYRQASWAPTNLPDVSVLGRILRNRS